jgi:hypothetical protein
VKPPPRRPARKTPPPTGFAPRPWPASTGTLFDVTAPPTEAPDDDDDVDGYIEHMIWYQLLRRATMHVALFLIHAVEYQHREGRYVSFSPPVTDKLIAKCELLGSTFDVGDSAKEINRQLNQALKTFGIITYDVRPGSPTPNWPMVNKPPGFTTDTLEGLLERAFRGEWPDLDLPFRDYSRELAGRVQRADYEDEPGGS